MCQYSLLDKGEKVELTTLGDTRCTNCSSDISQYSGPAIYQGHQDNGGMTVDSFVITGSWQCASCHERIRQYITPCDDYGSLVTLPAYKFDEVLAK